jgi:hypothetical protein
VSELWGDRLGETLGWLRSHLQVVKGPYVAAFEKPDCGPIGAEDDPPNLRPSRALIACRHKMDPASCLFGVAMVFEDLVWIWREEGTLIPTTPAVPYPVCWWP